MNRAARRATARAQRNQAIGNKIASEKRNEANRAIKFQNAMYLSATALTLHRTFGFGQARCLRALEAISNTAFEADCAEQLIEQVKAEIGISIGSEVEHD